MSRIHTFCLLIAHFLAISFINPNFAQTGNEINVSIAITPPYSPYLSDYINFEGAILMLQNNTSQTQNIVLRGLIEGDNGLFAETKEDYLPPQPIQLGGYESISFFSGSPEFDFMSINNIETNVSSELQGSTWRTGVLPEGNYSICVRAFDYVTGAAISQPIPAGCTTITITYPQPPVIVNPQCETEVQDPLPSIIWTPPAGNLVGANILYDLYILKLQPGFQGTQDPYYAMQLAVDYNAGNPLVVRNLQLTNYQYSPGDPPLIQDATYAVQVIARDENENVIIENEGKSDVCTFVWKGGQSEFDPGVVTTAADPGLVPTPNIPVQFFVMTSLSGKMVYKFTPHFTGVSPLSSFNAIVQTTQSNFSNVASGTPQFFFDNLHLQSTIPSAPYPEGAQYFDHDIISASTFDKPLAWTPIRLVTRYITNTGLVSKTANVITSPGSAIIAPPDNGQVLTVTTTDADGNYNFNFVQAVTGQVGEDLFRIITLEVVSPYFCSPDIKILSLPGDNIQLPLQAALVRTYNLNVNIKSDQTEDQSKGKGTPLSGVEVNINGDYFFCNEPQSLGQIVQAGQGNLEAYVMSSDISESKITNDAGWASFQGLVRHNINEVDDRLRVSANTDDIDIHQSNYIGKPIFEIYPESITATMEDLEPWAAFESDNPIFNSERIVESYELHLEMAPEEPRIFGRVAYDAAYLEGVEIWLWDTDKNIQLAYDLSDKGGYFLFDNVTPGVPIKLTFSKPGFQTSEHHLAIMKMGDYIFYEHQMPYPGDVYGYVRDERGDPVMADVKLGEDFHPPFVKTEIVSATEIQPIGTATGVENVKVTVKKAKFISPAYLGENIPLEILPRSDKYFPHTFYLDINDLNVNNPSYIGDFTMFEKLHRIRFRVVTEAPNSMVGPYPIPNAKVEIKEQGLTKYTDINGEAYFKYASPGSWFWVKVTPPVGSDFTPFYEKMHLPITKTDSIHTIVLKSGYTINGIVTAGLDSFPLSGAKVFVKSDISNGQGFVPLIQTISNSDGTFELKGIPTDPTFHAIHAVKSSPDTAFIGNFVLVSKNTTSPVNIHLDIIEGLNLSEIWELPVEIEELFFEEENMYVSGAFVNTPDNLNFQKTETDQRLPFYNLWVTASENVDVNGNQYLEPNENYVDLALTAIPVKMQSHFFGDIISHTAIQQLTSSSDFQIKVLKDNNSSGFVKGIANLDLSSFMFSYNLSAEISLADDSLNFKIPIFTADPNTYTHKPFHIGTATPEGFDSLTYEVHEFKASADLMNSTIFEDTVKFKTLLHTNIPKCVPTDLRVNVGYIKVIPTDILEFYGDSSLSFNLEEWEVFSTKSWKFDKNHGAIVLDSARINTNVIDLDIGDLMIKPNDLKIDHSDLIGKVNLAGVTYLHLLPGSKTTFLFDEYRAGGPHWKFSVMPIHQQSTDPVAEIAALPGMEPSDKVNIGKFELLSNDEVYMGQFDQTITFYKVFDLKLDGNALSTYQNSFELRGKYNLNIPNLSSDHSAILEFTKPGNEIEMKLFPPFLEFEAAGNVTFKAHQTQNAFTFSDGLFEALGDITISDSTEIYVLQGRLTRTENEIRVDIITQDNDGGQNQVIPFGGSPDKYLEVVEGRMEVIGPQWEKLWFDGLTVGLGEGIKDPRRLHFIAHGSVNVDEGEIEVTGVETPFGDITITFDFINMALHGHLEYVGTIKLGPYVTIKQITAELQVDGEGFYFGLGLKMDFMEIIMDVRALIILGAYPEFDEHLLALLEEYSPMRPNPPEVFVNGINGFIISATWMPLNIEEEGDIGIASYYLYASAGVNLMFYAYFLEPVAFGMEITVEAGLSLEMTAWLPPPAICEVSAGILFNIALMVGIQSVDGEVDFIGCASLGLGFYFEMCEIVEICEKTSIRADLRWGTSTDWNVECETDIGGPSCTGKPIQFNSPNAPDCD